MSAARHSIWLGLLPYTGVILFLIQLPFVWSEGATEVLRQAVIFMIGWTGLGAGISHLFFAEKIASSIGFQRNQFQMEVGFAGLAIGATALVVTAYPSQYWLAIILVSSLYRFGCSVVHIRDMTANRNFAINNTGILVLDIVVPVCLLAGYYLHLA